MFLNMNWRIDICCFSSFSIFWHFWSRKGSTQSSDSLLCCFIWPSFRLMSTFCAAVFWTTLKNKYCDSSYISSGRSQVWKDCGERRRAFAIYQLSCLVHDAEWLLLSFIVLLVIFTLKHILEQNRFAQSAFRSVSWRYEQRFDCGCERSQNSS